MARGGGHDYGVVAKSERCGIEREIKVKGSKGQRVKGSKGQRVKGCKVQYRLRLERESLSLLLLLHYTLGLCFYAALGVATAINIQIEQWINKQRYIKAINHIISPVQLKLVLGLGSRLKVRMPK